jgi:hypothetical protein
MFPGPDLARPGKPAVINVLQKVMKDGGLLEEITNGVRDIRFGRKPFGYAQLEGKIRSMLDFVIV